MAFGAPGFEAVQIGVRAVSLFIMLNTPICDLAIYRIVNPSLSFTDLLHDLGATSDDVHGRPTKQSSHRTQVGTEAVAPDARRFEGDAAASTEGVANSYPMAKLR